MEVHSEFLLLYRVPTPASHATQQQYLSLERENKKENANLLSSRSFVRVAVTRKASIMARPSEFVWWLGIPESYEKEFL